MGKEWEKAGKKDVVHSYICHKNLFWEILR
jgi:hypothetical protein